MSSSNPDHRPPRIVAGGAVTWSPDAVREPVASEPTVERYRFEAVIGQGGMGKIWRAYDSTLCRHVAVKLVEVAGMDDAMFSRVAQEAQITGQLEHPNIVPVHDLGRTADGQLYFTMKEVRGDSLTEVIRSTWTSIHEGEEARHDGLLRLVGILMRVCEAVAFAHSRGVIHRDLKPDNVMVGEFGEVQLMDWGLARILDEGPQGLGQVAGTPGFMAPEQARGQGDQIGPHTDAWALGAILYEMVCGVAAYTGEVEAILGQVARGHVEAPSTRGRVPRELEAVVLRTMEPRIEQRYTVDELRHDLQAWMTSNPLGAVDYSWVELSGKWVSRNRRIVRSVALTTAVALAVLSVLLYRYVSDVTVAREVAELEARNARIRFAEGQVATADALAANLEYVEAEVLYLEAMEGLEQTGQPLISAELGLWRTLHASQRALFHAPGEVLGAHPDGASAYLRDGTELVQLALPVPAVLGRWPAPQGEVVDHYVVDGVSVVYTRHDGAIWRTELPAGAPERWVDVDLAWSARVSPDGTHAIMGVTGQTQWLFERRPDETWTRSLLSDDGLLPLWFTDTLVMLSRYKHRTELWNYRTQERIRLVDPLFTRPLLSPDGRTLVVYTESTQRLRREDLVTGEVAWERDSQHLSPMGYSPDGALVFVQGLEPTQVALDVESGEPVMRYEGHRARATQHLFLADVWVTTQDDVQVWPYPARPLGQVLGDLDADDVALSPDGSLLASTADDLSVYDAVSGTRLGHWALSGTSTQLDFDSDGSRIAVSVPPDRVALVDLRVGTVEERVVGEAVFSVELDEGALFVSFRDGSVLALDAEDGAEVWRTQATPKHLRWDLSVDRTRGRLYATAFETEVLQVLDLDSGSVVDEWEVPHSTYMLSVWDDRVAVGSGEGVRVFDVTGARLFDLSGHDGPSLSQAPSPDGGWMVTADYGYPVRIFDLTTGEHVYADQTHTGPTGWVWWPHPRVVVSVSGDGRVLRRDLDARTSLQRGAEVLGRMAAGESPSAADRLAAARTLQLRELQTVAAPMLSTGDPVEEARAWHAAGYKVRALAALQRPGPDRSDVLSILWRRMLAEP